MTGRDGGADLRPIGNAPVVVLVRPQLADNIGACAPERISCNDWPAQS